MILFKHFIHESDQKLLTAYHGTRGNFDPNELKPHLGSFGIHIGTMQQAKQRGISQIFEIKFKNEGIVNSIFDFHGVIPVDTVKKSLKLGMLTQDEATKFETLYNQKAKHLLDTKWAYDNMQVEVQLRTPFHKMIGDFLTKKGYNGVKYINRWEGNTKDPNNFSYVLFTNKTIVSIKRIK